MLEPKLRGLRDQYGVEIEGATKIAASLEQERLSPSRALRYIDLYRGPNLWTIAIKCDRRGSVDYPCVGENDIPDTLSRVFDECIESIPSMYQLNRGEEFKILTDLQVHKDRFGQWCVQASRWSSVYEGYRTIEMYSGTKKTMRENVRGKRTRLRNGIKSGVLLSGARSKGRQNIDEEY